MSKVFLVDLEAVETRYTGQWKAHVPNLLRKAGHEVHVISGPSDIPSATTPGAFLNFGGTNIYKATKLNSLEDFFVQDPSRLAIILSLLTLGIQASLT